MKKLLILFACLPLLGACTQTEPVSGNRAAAIVAEIHNPRSKYVVVASHRGDWRNYPENSIAAIECGASRIDASVAGLGGCPYANGATGNVATEDVVYLLQGLGIDCGADLDRLAATGRWLAAQLGRETGSRVGKALVHD